MDSAVRALGAFLHVVSELYGPEEARRSAEDWLNELELLEFVPEAPGQDWRTVTIAAGRRLAERVHRDLPTLTRA
jgi:hypothetical protein